MLSPPKPWEIPSNNFRSVPVSASSYSSRAATGIRKVERRPMEENDDTKQPPAPPPRPQRQTNTLSNNYGYGGYSSYGGYQPQYNYGGYSGGYGGYGGTYNNYGGTYNNTYGGYNGMRGYGPNQPTSSFVEQAEQNSRVAFDSIHSIVQAFGSIAMMFESTFFAVHSSFRAVLGVADHFSRLRHNLVEAIGNNFLIKWMRSIFRKIMVLLRLRNPGSIEEIWGEVRSAAMGQTGAEEKQVWRSWPLLLFFGVVLGTPWLIWKFLSSLGKEVEQHKHWMTGDGDHVLGKALFDFVGEGEDELTFCAGDCLRIAPKDKQPRIRGWLLATVDGTSKGIVPANYVKILGLKRAKRAASVVHVDEPQRKSSIENEYSRVLEESEIELENARSERTDLEQEYNMETTTDLNSSIDIPDNINYKNEEPATG